MRRHFRSARVEDGDFRSWDQHQERLISQERFDCGRRRLRRNQRGTRKWRTDVFRVAFQEWEKEGVVGSVEGVGTMEASRASADVEDHGLDRSGESGGADLPAELIFPRRPEVAVRGKIRLFSHSEVAVRGKISSADVEVPFSAAMIRLQVAGRSGEALFRNSQERFVRLIYNSKNRSNIVGLSSASRTRLREPESYVTYDSGSRRRVRSFFR